MRPPGQLARAAAARPGPGGSSESILVPNWAAAMLGIISRMIRIPSRLDAVAEAAECAHWQKAILRIRTNLNPACDGVGLVRTEAAADLTWPDPARGLPEPVSLCLRPGRSLPRGCDRRLPAC